MPDEGFLEQPGPAVCDPDETASKPTQAGRSGRVWTGLPLLLVGVSLLPLVRDPFYSDAEHLPYQDLARSPNPLLDPARTAIADIGPYIENQGTFRPLGRAFRAYATSWTVRIAEFSGLTPHVVWGLLRCLFGMAAAYGALLLARSFVEVGSYDAPNNDEPAGDRLILPICVAFSFGMIAAGLTGAPIFFPSSYLVVVLIIGASLRWIARPELWLSAPTLSPRHAARAVVSAAIGAALAAWGEVSAIAVPMVLFWAVVMLWVHRRDALRVLTSLGSICCGILVASFLLVTVVGRMAIGRACAAGGCYRYSEFRITSDTPSTLVTRLCSSVPPVRYLWAISNVRAYLSVVVLVVAVVIATAVTILVTRRQPGPPASAAGTDEDGRSSLRLTPATRPNVIPLVLAGAVLVVLSELVPALSVGFQQATGRVGMGQAWRNSALSAAGWALVMTAIWLLVAPRVSRTVRRVMLVGIAAMWALVPVTNAAFAAWSASSTSGRVNAAIGRAFVSSGGAQDANCGLIREWARLPPSAGGSADPDDRFTFMSTRLNGARQSLGLPDFCPAAGDAGLGTSDAGPAAPSSPG